MDAIDKAIGRAPPNAMARSLPSGIGRIRRRKRVIRDGLRALQGPDKAIEQRLGGEVGDIYDRVKADPGPCTFCR